MAAPPHPGSHAGNGARPGPANALPEGALPLTGWRQTFSSLSGNPDFALLYGGNVLFFFGMNSMIIIRGWLVIDKWDNASYLGFLMGTVAIPMLLLAPVAGVVTDRVDKRLLLLTAQLALVGTNAVVSVLVLTDAIEFWHLLAVSTVSGGCFAFVMPARQALVATLVPREKLMNAMALSTAAMNASRVIAPPLGGLLIVLLSIGGAYAVSTAFFGLAVLATFRLPSLRAVREREFTFFEDFVEGFSYIRRTPLLLGLLLFATVPMIFAMPYQTLLPVFAERVWHVGEIGFGVLQGVAGAGGLIGALAVANLDAYPKKGRLLFGAALAFGGFLALFALSPFFVLALVFMTAIGFVSMVMMTVNNTAIQLIIPDEVRGRVMSVMMMTFGLMPLGAVPAGVAAESVGVQGVVTTSAALFVASVALIFLVVPSLRAIDRVLSEERRDRRAPALYGRAAAPIAAGEPR
jgi:MFS family permease